MKKLKVQSTPEAARLFSRLHPENKKLSKRLLMSFTKILTSEMN